jgi:hypothetical protein
MTQEDPDLALVQNLQAGKDRALSSLMDRHREGLFRFVLRQVHNEADALELTWRPLSGLTSTSVNFGRRRGSQRGCTGSP